MFDLLNYVVYNKHQCFRGDKMENTNNAIVYIYKRKKLDEDEDFITYTYDFIGISLVN